MPFWILYVPCMWGSLDSLLRVSCCTLNSGGCLNACCMCCATPGELPAFTAEWDIERGATVQDQIKRHITAAAAAGQPGRLLPDGAVLWVRLHDDCDEKVVAAALAEVTQQLLPRIQCDKTLDVQVRTGLGACFCCRVGGGCATLNRQGVL